MTSQETNELTPVPGRLGISRKVWSYFAAFFVMGLGVAAVGPTLVELAQQTNGALKDISIVFSMRALGYLIMARFIGHIYDKSHGHRVMSMAMVCMGAFYFAVPFATHLWVLSPVILLAGIASAFVDLGGNIMILWAVKKNLGPNMNGLHFSFGLGAFVSPILVALILQATSVGIYIYTLIGLLSLPVAFWIFKTPAPKHPAVSKKYEDAPGRLPPLLLGIIVLFFILYAGSEQSLGGWIHTYGVRQNGMEEVTASYLTSLFWGAIALGRLLAIPLAQRFQAKYLVLVQTFGTAIVYVMMMLFPHVELVTWLGAGLAGLLMSSIFPLMLAYLERYIAGSGKLTSWVFIGASTGGMSMPWIIGQYVDQEAPLFIPGSLFVCMALGTVAIIVIMRMLQSR